MINIENLSDMELDLLHAQYEKLKTAPVTAHLTNQRQSSVE
jgi:hypothetical protein